MLKRGISCETCLRVFDSEKQLHTSSSQPTYQYLATIDHGGLTFPTAEVVQATDCVHRVHSCIALEESGKYFVVCGNQVAVLKALSFEYFVAQHCRGRLLRRSSVCASGRDILWQRIVMTATKTFHSKFVLSSDESEKAVRNMAQAKRDAKKTKKT